MARQGEQPGFFGLGKYEADVYTRMMKSRVSTLKKKVEGIAKRREIFREHRRKLAFPTIALAGYTAAGKTSLFNLLTGETKSVDAGVFTTLAPTTRAVMVGERKTLLTDTVGFISKLPHQLVDAFAATLEETGRAELLVHVLDGSAPAAQREVMAAAVDATLEEIGAGDRPRVLAINKADLLDADEREDLRLRHPDAVLVSATTGEGLDALRERLERELLHTLRPLHLLVPYADGGSLAELHELAGDVQREDTPDGVRVDVLVPARLAGRFERFAIAS